MCANAASNEMFQRAFTPVNIAVRTQLVYLPQNTYYYGSVELRFSFAFVLKEKASDINRPRPRVHYISWLFPTLSTQKLFAF